MIGGMMEKKDDSRLSSAYWVGFFLCFGMNIAQNIDKVDTVLDGLLHIILSVVLSFTSWIGVGVNIVQLLGG